MTELKKEDETLQVRTAVEKDISALSRAMTDGIRRWEKVLYPMMVAFIILAIYGFYLIYNITQDMRNMSNNMETITKEMHEMTKDFGQITENMLVMTKAVVTMTNTMNRKLESIDGRMVSMDVHLAHLNASIDGMENSFKNTNTYMSELNQSVEKIEGDFRETNQHMENMNGEISKVNQQLGKVTTTLHGIHQAVYFMGYSTNNMSHNLSELNGNISAPMSSFNSMVPWSVMPKNQNMSPPSVPYLPQGNR